MKKNVYRVLIVWGVLSFHLPQFWLMAFMLFPKTGSGSWRDALFNALLMGAWGGLHSVLARDFSQKIMARIVGKDFVRILYVTIAGLTQCALLYLWRPLAGEIWRVQGGWWWVGAGVFFVVAGGVWISSILLDYMETLGVRAVIRRMRGEKAPPPSLSLKGPYAHCRHPVYLFTLFFLWIGPVMNMTRFEFAFLGTLYVLAGMFLEDRDTARILGADYEEYQKNVPILIPRLTPWKHGRNGLE